MYQQWRLNAQLGEQNIELIRHANDVTFTCQKWQFATLGYYIPKAIVAFQLAPVIGYLTFELIFVLFNHNKFIIGAQPTFNPIGTTT